MVSPQRFEVQAEAESVPGLMWFDGEIAGARPTVLMAHGRAGDKSDPFLAAQAQRFAERGCLAVALDAPGHGERRAASDDPMPPKPSAGQVRIEWQACLDHLIAEGRADLDAVAYWGFSMGTGVGLALLANEPRIRCAALGLMHTRYYPELLADAANVTCPLFFSLHWDDSRVPRQEAFELFDALGASDKRLHAYPGDHADFTEEELRAAEAFIASQLGAADAVTASGGRLRRAPERARARTSVERPEDRMPDHKTPDPSSAKPEAAREGDVNDDRQDPPLPPKTSGSDEDLDGFTSTPGDTADDEES